MAFGTFNKLGRQKPNVPQAINNGVSNWVENERRAALGNLGQRVQNINNELIGTTITNKNIPKFNI